LVLKNILMLRNSDFRWHLADGQEVDRTENNRVGDVKACSERGIPTKAPA
jgi:hypothetical protein